MECVVTKEKGGDVGDVIEETTTIGETVSITDEAETAGAGDGCRWDSDIETEEIGDRSWGVAISSDWWCVGDEWEEVCTRWCGDSKLDAERSVESVCDAGKKRIEDERGRDVVAQIPRVSETAASAESLTSIGIGTSMAMEFTARPAT